MRKTAEELFEWLERARTAEARCETDLAAAQKNTEDARQAILKRMKEREAQPAEEAPE